MTHQPVTLLDPALCSCRAHSALCMTPLPLARCAAPTPTCPMDQHIQASAGPAAAASTPHCLARSLHRPALPSLAPPAGGRLPAVQLPVHPPGAARRQDESRAAYAAQAVLAGGWAVLRGQPRCPHAPRGGWGWEWGWGWGWVPTEHPRSSCGNLPQETRGPCAVSCVLGSAMLVIGCWSALVVPTAVPTHP